MSLEKNVHYAKVADFCLCLSINQWKKCEYFPHVMANLSISAPSSEIFAACNLRLYYYVDLITS